MDLLQEYDKTMKSVREIVGVAMTVYNEWGSGLLESAYEAAMEHLLKKSGHVVERQKQLPLYWKGEKLDETYRMDLVVDGIIVELKSCKFVSQEHRHQLKNYMHVTKNSYGVLINFSGEQVYSEAYKLYEDNTIEKVPLKMNPVTKD